MPFRRTSKVWLAAGLLGASLLVGACKDDGCSDDQLVALTIDINNPDRLLIRVTAELDSEERCGFFNMGHGPVWTCWEQGRDGGTYTVRVYNAGEVIYSEEVEVETDGCHVTDPPMIGIDLTGLGPSAALSTP
jgi:hypothetical protein